jgi:hypothetical protein
MSPSRLHSDWNECSGRERWTKERRLLDVWRAGAQRAVPVLEKAMVDEILCCHYVLQDQVDRTEGWGEPLWATPLQEVSQMLVQ